MKRALLLVVMACGTPETMVEPPVVTPPEEQQQQPVTGLPCDVHAALTANCAGCHNGETYAPHFITRAQFVEAGTKLTERMLDAERPMPPVQAQRQPTLQERVLIGLWVQQGMPGGACGDVR